VDSDRVHLGEHESMRNVKTALKCLNLFSVGYCELWNIRKTIDSSHLKCLVFN